MLLYVIRMLLILAKTEVVKEAIGVGVNKLLKSKEDGITKDIAKVMIDGIVASKSNPTKYESFKGVIDELK